MGEESSLLWDVCIQYCGIMWGVMGARMAEHANYCDNGSGLRCHLWWKYIARIFLRN